MIEMSAIDEIRTKQDKKRAEKEKKIADKLAAKKLIEKEKRKELKDKGII